MEKTILHLRGWQSQSMSTSKLEPHGTLLPNLCHKCDGVSGSNKSKANTKPRVRASRVPLTLVRDPQKQRSTRPNVSGKRKALQNTAVQSCQATHAQQGNKRLQMKIVQQEHSTTSKSYGSLIIGRQSNAKQGRSANAN